MYWTLLARASVIQPTVCGKTKILRVGRTGTGTGTGTGTVCRRRCKVVGRLSDTIFIATGSSMVRCSHEPPAVSMNRARWGPNSAES
jgi:hypothetical protein